MKPVDVVDFVMSCLAEAEADAYQQQEGDPIHDKGVRFGRVDHKTIWVEIGEDEEFWVTVVKKRAAQPTPEPTG